MQAICCSRDGVPKDTLLLIHFLEPGAAYPERAARYTLRQAIYWSLDGVPKDALLLDHFLEPGAAYPERDAR